MQKLNNFEKHKPILSFFCRMLFLIGLGFGDCKDITVRGLEAVRQSSKVYLEAYTSILTVGAEELVSLFAFSFIYIYTKHT